MTSLKWQMISNWSALFFLVKTESVTLNKIFLPTLDYSDVFSKHYLAIFQMPFVTYTTCHCKPYINTNLTHPRIVIHVVISFIISLSFLTKQQFTFKKCNAPPFFQNSLIVAITVKYEHDKCFSFKSLHHFIFHI